MAVTSDGQFCLRGRPKRSNSITVFQRNGNALQYVQTLKQNVNSAIDPSASSSTDWANVIQASNPLDWYRFDDTPKFDIGTQSLSVDNNFLYDLSQSAGTLRVFGRDGSGQFNNLLQTITGLSNPVSFAASPAGDFLFVLAAPSSNQESLSSYTRDSSAGTLAFETSTTLFTTGFNAPVPNARGARHCGWHAIFVTGAYAAAWTSGRTTRSITVCLL